MFRETVHIGPAFNNEEFDRIVSEILFDLRGSNIIEWDNNSYQFICHGFPELALEIYASELADVLRTSVVIRAWQSGFCNSDWQEQDSKESPLINRLREAAEFFHNNKIGHQEWVEAFGKKINRVNTEIPTSQNEDDYSELTDQLLNEFKIWQRGDLICGVRRGLSDGIETIKHIESLLREQKRAASNKYKSIILKMFSATTIEAIEILRLDVLRCFEALDIADTNELTKPFAKLIDTDWSADLAQQKSCSLIRERYVAICNEARRRGANAANAIVEASKLEMTPQEVEHWAFESICLLGHLVENKETRKPNVIRLYILLLKDAEFKKIEPRIGDRFVPSEHEPIQFRDGASSGIVLDVLETGYRKHDRVLQKAKVVLSS